jgi:hypothetical protein
VPFKFGGLNSLLVKFNGHLLFRSTDLGLCWAAKWLWII